MRTRILFCVFVAGIFFSRLVADEPAADFNLNQFLKPVTLTESDLLHFFKCYNCSFYTQRFLPSCFLNVTDLLGYAKDQKDPAGYTYSVMSLFLERIKGCTWINPFALTQLIEELPRHLGKWISSDNQVIDLKSFITGQMMQGLRLVHAKLLEELPQDLELCTSHTIDQVAQLKDFIADQVDNLPFFNKETAALLEPLSTSIIERVNHLQATLQVQNIIVRFIESALDKLVWDPEDKLVAWESFKVLGKDLELFYQKIAAHEPDAFNHALWSLVYRFCYFIELCGSSLPDEWYAVVLRELPTVQFLSYAEQERFIKTKIQVLSHALKIGAVKARAYKHGVITDV